ncbi:MAG: flgG [Rickettsiaceae bacterium]|jgi:flagellar basal-body rod protein FlgG|nr:flgG [Rickettsiaceae bacterium]
MTINSVNYTGSTMDIYIAGSDYFKVELPNGDIGYTRNGQLYVNAQGNLVSRDGYILTDHITFGNIAINTISISHNGQISAPHPDDRTVIIVLGALTVHKFTDELGLQLISPNIFAETNLSGPAQENTPGTNGAGMLHQGYLEVELLGSEAES